MPKITIDGKPIECEAGKTVLQAALENKIYIPHFCYHPGLEIAGNCRMCLVEVEKARKLQIACNTYVQDGMVVKTNTDQVREAREAVMEFLLINHPLDCPICDQAGECVLQDYAHRYGSGRSRFDEEKEKKPKKVPFSDNILFDAERCILCARCVRFMADVAGDPVLDIWNRGDRAIIAKDPEREITSPYSMNIIDLCPVGALTSRDFRFKTRVWFLTNTLSVCNQCARGCNIVIGSRDDRIHRYVPRENPQVNQWWMCDPGRLSYHRLYERPRLDAPKVARDGALAETDWGTALDRAAELLRSPNIRGALAGIGSARAATEELYLFRCLMRDTLKAEPVDYVARFGDGDDLLIQPDKNPNSRGARLVGVGRTEAGLDLAALRAAIERGEIRGLVVMGEDIAREDPAMAAALAKLDALVVIDYAETETARRAHVLLAGATFAEKSGTFVNFQGRVQKIHPAVARPGKAEEDWKILNELICRVAPGSEYPSLERVSEEMTEQIPALGNITLKRLGPQGSPLADSKSTVEAGA